MSTNEINRKPTMRSQPSDGNNRLLRRQFLRQLSLAWGPLALAPGFTGCQLFQKSKCEILDTRYLDAFHSFSFYLSPLYQTQRPRRILVIWETQARPAQPFQVRFAEQMADQFRSQRIAEMVVDRQLPGCACDLMAILKGRFDEYALLDITDRYHCDALIITRVNELVTHWPLQISASVALIDRAEAVVLMAADGNWDLGRRELVGPYESYVKQFAVTETPEFSDIQKRSPRNLESFVAWQIAHKVASHST